MMKCTVGDGYVFQIVGFPRVSLFDLEQEKLRKRERQREEREQKEIHSLQEEYRKQQVKLRQEELKKREEVSVVKADRLSC